MFICHASVDKERYVRPFAVALAVNGISYWLDEAEIGWGQHLTVKINEGLARSRYVVVFLTQAFLERHWPQIEMGSAPSLEASTGELVVLLIMVAPEGEVFAQYPLLRDKLYMRWQDGIDAVISALRETLGIAFKSHWVYSHPASYSGQVCIQLVAKHEDIGTQHSCSLRWGPWKRHVSLGFGSGVSEVLVHGKGDDGLSVPLLVDISPPCYVRFGQGDPPPVGQIHDINNQWSRVAGA